MAQGVRRTKIQGWRAPQGLWPRLPNWQFCGLSPLRSMPFEVDRSIFSDSVLGMTRLSESSQSFNNNLTLELISILCPLFRRRGWFAYVPMAHLGDYFPARSKDKS